MRIKKLMDIDLNVPKQQTKHSAGYDLCAAESHVILPGQQALIPTGWAWEIPYGWVGLIKDRSGTAKKYRLITHAGVIDSDYRGDVGIIIENCGDRPYHVAAGERIAQMVVTHCSHETLEVVDALDSTKRGENGYGHTGK